MTDELAVEKYLSNPQGLTEQIKKTRDLHLGFEYIKLAYGIVSTIDSSLDLVLPVMEDVFYEDKPKEFSGMEFEEVIIRSTPLSRETILRHTRVGRMLELAPEEVRPAIEQMNFKSKIQIANTVEDGLPISKEQWTQLADAYYPQEVSMTLHEIKGTQPRSQFCKWEEENGTLYAVTDIGRIPIAERTTYDNPETEGKAEWAWNKMLRKLDIYKRTK